MTDNMLTGNILIDSVLIMVGLPIFFLVWILCATVIRILWLGTCFFGREFLKTMEWAERVSK